MSTPGMGAKDPMFKPSMLMRNANNPMKSPIKSPAKSPIMPSTPSIASPRSNMISGSPKPATTGTGACQNITITVNATEKNLGQKIANEVRAVLFNNQVA